MQLEIEIDPCLPEVELEHELEHEHEHELEHELELEHEQQQQQQHDSEEDREQQSPSRDNNNSPSPQSNLIQKSNNNLLSSLDPTLESIHHFDPHHTTTTDPNLIHHHHHPRSPKRKRYSEPDQADNDHSNPSNRPSLDTLQLAHLITSIQVQQQAASAQLEPGSSSSHLQGYTPLPNYLLQSAVAEQEWKDKIDGLLNPLKLEICCLRSRIETLENERLEMAREITSLKGCFNNYSQPTTTTTTNNNNNNNNAHQTPIPNRDQSRIFTAGINSNSNHSFDIPVGPLSDLVPANSNNLNSVLSTSQNPEPKSTFPFRIPDSAASSSKYETDLPFRRISNSRKKSDVPSSSFNTPSSTPGSSNNRGKHRKPELSRTVRATVFRLMGVSSIHSPIPASASLPIDPGCNFGSEKSRAYHGYTTSPCFPEYTSEELFDPITKEKLWRWDWSKTIRQSQNNTNFAKEIRNVIVKEAADPIRPLHTDVPASDWQFLNDAIDSAYTNMRRERDNLIDPTKMVKKEVHRARNKKRGLKEDKYKRRKKALDEYRADPQSFEQRLRDLNLTLADKPGRAQTSVGAGSGPEGRWEDGLDIKYMSSEDEANMNDFEHPIAVGLEQAAKADNTLASSDKVFAICRPTWRSAQLQNLFSFLDAVKQPERAYRRVMGPPRVAPAPFGTPAWMVRERSDQQPEPPKPEPAKDESAHPRPQP